MTTANTGEFIRVLEGAEELTKLVGEGTYLYATGVDERSMIGEGATGGLSVVQLDRYTVEWSDRAEQKHLMEIRSGASIETFVARLADPIFIDITGMSCEIWAVVLRVLFAQSRQVQIVYVEPRDYRRNDTPTDTGDVFNLSDRTQGVDSLLGFTRISSAEDGVFVFVPLLGFEGHRVLHVASSLEDLADNSIFPVLPAPGFRLEYPSFTFMCNAPLIYDNKCWVNICYATAYDPFAMFLVLDEIASDSGIAQLRVSLTGTKPHAFGAILHRLIRHSDVDLIYDNPVEVRNRSEGIGRIFVYDAVAFKDRFGV